MKNIKFADKLPANPRLAANEVNALKKAINRFTTVAIYDDDVTVATSQCYGGVIFLTATKTVTLPVAKPGMALTVVMDAPTVVGSIAPATGEVLRLNAVDKDADATVSSAGDAADLCSLIYHSPGKWYLQSDTWT